MRSSSHPNAARRLRAALGCLAASLLVTLLAPPVAAQQARKYLVEVGAGGSYQGFADETDLESGIGAALRLGLWLPYNFSIEGEGSFFSPKTTGAPITGQQFDWSARTFTGSLLYNIRIGATNSIFARAGLGSVRFDGDECGPASVPGSGPCGSTQVAVGGLGARFGLTPTLQLRVEGFVARPRFIEGVNYGANLGLSLMLGSTSYDDTDADGVYDNADRCPSTPAGFRVDSRGCPMDTDGDRVPDGRDRCERTPAGATVDATGCPIDSDEDGVADGIDRCADTPTGSLVNEFGCPTDSDRDGVADGLDRCSETPEGAVVDQLGCPGDEDGDGVLDGLDRCPRTPSGTAINAFGCPPNQDADADGVNDTDDRCPGTPTGADVDANGCRAGEVRPPSDTAAAGGAADGATGIVLQGVTFNAGSARLRPESYPVLDSVAVALNARPDLMVEIGGHTDNTGSAADNEHLSRLRAEAVREYLIRQGVAFRRMVARGYGSTVPVSTENTPAAQARNRRVEIKPIAPPQ